MALPFSRIRASFVCACLAAAALMLPMKAGAVEPGERAQIEQIIRDYLLANPELMLEVQDALEQKREAQRVAAQKQTLSEHSELIFSSKHQIEVGNPEAPITVVEFFDYNCGFCQRAIEDMNKLVETGNVRFVLKEFPILSQQSAEAHKVSIAFAKLMPEKAAEFHRTLLGEEGRKDGETALELGVALGADRETLKAESEKPEVVDAIREVHMLAEGLGITGTPSYVIGDEVVFGAVGYDKLSKKIAELGDCGKLTC